MTRALAVVLAGAAALAAAGCREPDLSFTLPDTRDCLAGKDGIRLSSNVDFVASTAPGGAVRVLLPSNQVVISFALNERQAAQVARGYRRARGRNIGIGDVLRPKGNAVLLWKAHPSAEDEDVVTGCLK